MGQKVLELVQLNDRPTLISALMEFYPHWGEEFATSAADRYLADPLLQKL